MADRIFIVPHDFTEAAGTALKHAINICNQTNAIIALVHIVNKDLEKRNAEQKLKAIINNASSNIPIRYYIIKGSIFSDIGKLAEKLNASAIIMATHGAKGMQKVFGSFAMKVIISTNVPFMIVQRNTEIKIINNLVLPINHSSESLQISSFARNIAEVYKSQIHIVAKKESNKTKAIKIKNHLAVLAKHLKKYNIDYHLKLIESKETWAQSILEYGSDINANMFALSFDSDRFLASTDKFSQALIFNKLNLPTLIINSKRNTILYY